MKANFFTRGKTTTESNSLGNAEIACDTAELRDLITKWTLNEGWKFSEFATFVALTGVKTPIKLSGLDKEIL